MRIKIEADVGDGIRLPVNYNHLLVGVIYHFLAESDAEYAAFLHDRCRTRRGGHVKLLVGKVLIETDNIEFVEWQSAHTVKIWFTSGYELEVMCGITAKHNAVWHKNACHFIQTLLDTNA